jgi:hypothetical protein
VEVFHRLAPYHADVYVVEVNRTQGESRYGMFAVPTWIKPSLWMGSPGQRQGRT